METDEAKTPPQAVTRLTSLVERRSGWHPGWPLKTWLVAVALVIAAPIVADHTRGRDRSTGEPLISSPVGS